MATPLADYDFTQPSTLTKAEKATYEWDDWLDGRPWKLVWGDDFQGHPLMFERIVRTRATGRDSRVTIRHERDTFRTENLLAPLVKDGTLTRAQKNAVIKALADEFGAVVIRRSDVTKPKAKRTRTAPVKAAAPKANGKAPAKKVGSKRPIRIVK